MTTGDTVTVASEAGGLDKLAQMLSEEHSVSSHETQAQRDRVIAQGSEIVGLKASMQVLQERLEGAIKDNDAHRKTNWPLVTSLLVLMPLLSAVLIYVITSQIDKSVTPISQQVATDTSDLKRVTQIADDLNRSSSASSTADQASRQDRAQLNDRIRNLETQTATAASDQRGQLEQTSARLLETEQQFHSVSNDENIRWAHQTGFNAMLWEKVFTGSRYPSEAFYPSSIYQTSPVPLGQK